MTATAAWTLALLFGAAIVLQRNWREDVHGTENKSGKGLLAVSEDWQMQLRRRVLPENAYQWLFQRDRRPVQVAYACVVGIVLLWLLGWAVWPERWPSTANFYITSLLLIMVVNHIITHSVARRIGSDRRDGNLELLLTTPLSPEEIVRGQIAGVTDAFRPIRWILFGLNMAMMIGGLFVRSWNGTALLSYFLVWSVFGSWSLIVGKYQITRVMWVAANTGRPTFAAFRSNNSGMWNWFWMFYQMRSLFQLGSTAAGTFPKGDVVETVFVILGTGIAYVVGISTARKDSCKAKLSAELRSIAEEPTPDRHDPRYRKWTNVLDRFPRAHPIDPLAGVEVK
jgi:hypothetical protein